MEEFRKKGFGTAMLNFMMRYAKEKNVPHVILSAESEAGFSLYQKLGFQTIGRFRCFEWREF